MVLTKKLNILASHLMRGPGCKTPLPARDALNKKAEAPLNLETGSGQAELQETQRKILEADFFQKIYDMDK